MDMNLDSKKITELRSRKAWSQQHLADTASISLRTVQRIEQRGIASQDSARALASAFSLKPEDLMAAPGFTGVRRVFKHLAACGLIIAGFFGVALYASFATAEPIMLSVKAYSGDAELGDMRLSNEFGVESEFTFTRELKLTLVSVATPEGLVYLQTKIYEFQEGQGFQLISTPSLLANYNQAAGVRVSNPAGKSYGFEITPEK